MSLDLKCIEDAVIKWAEEYACRKAIIAHPNAPRPTVPYTLINIMTPTVIGDCEDKYEAIDPVAPETVRSIKAEYSHVYNLLVSINFYRDSAMAAAIKLRDSVCLITVKDQLWADGLAFVTTSEIRDVPEIIDQQWEERAQVDFFFHSRSIEEETINEIKQVELTNEIDGSTTTIPETII
jgi:hypothetical protein